MKATLTLPAGLNTNSAITSGESHLRNIELITGDETKSVESLFEDVFENASVLQVDSTCSTVCRPLRSSSVYLYRIYESDHSISLE